MKKKTSKAKKAYIQRGVWRYIVLWGKQLCTQRPDRVTAVHTRQNSRGDSIADVRTAGYGRGGIADRSYLPVMMNSRDVSPVDISFEFGLRCDIG